MLKYSVLFISSEGHERSRFSKSVTDLIGVWRETRLPGSAQVGISIHVQGSAGSVTFSTMMKIHWCGWARMSGTSSAVVTGRCRTNKIKSKVWCISGYLDTPVKIESALIDFHPLLEPSWGRTWSLLDACDICISSYVPLCFHSIVGGSLTGLNQISRVLVGLPSLLSGCPIPLFITSLCGCFE